MEVKLDEVWGGAEDGAEFAGGADEAGACGGVEVVGGRGLGEGGGVCARGSVWRRHLWLLVSMGGLQ